MTATRMVQTLPAGTTLSIADHAVTLTQDTLVEINVPQRWPAILRSVECQLANTIGKENGAGLREFGERIAHEAGRAIADAIEAGQPFPRATEMGEPL